jgi:C4-dicarboxylate-specific signal transduction histidine kinase
MSDEPHTTLTDQQVRRLADHLAPHAFPHLAHALLQSTHSILGRWRSQTMKVLPHLDDMSIKEFEDSIATILIAIAEAMEAKDPMAVRSLLDKAPEHGFDRFLQKYNPYDLFTEERILRKVIVAELDAQMGRPATKEEAVALHELLDIMSHFALFSLYRKRTAEAREAAEHAARNESLASLGTLALDVGHDLSNLLLPLRAHLEALRRAPETAELRDHVEVLERITNRMEDLSANLRSLAADPARSEAPTQNR